MQNYRGDSSTKPTCIQSCPCSLVYLISKSHPRHLNHTYPCETSLTSIRSNALVREQQRSPKAVPGEEKLRRCFPVRSPLFSDETKAVPIQPSRRRTLQQPGWPGGGMAGGGSDPPVAVRARRGSGAGSAAPAGGDRGDRRGGGRAAVATRGIAGVAAG